MPTDIENGREGCRFSFGRLEKHPPQPQKQSQNWLGKVGHNAQNEQ